MSKTCSKCGKSKDTTDFWRWKKSPDGFFPMCKVCQKDSARKSVQRLRDKLRLYKSQHPCVHCNESDPATLTFHHRDPAEKSFKISAGVTEGRYSWARILEEINKCDVMCHNCHIKLHYPDQTRKYKMRKVGNKMYRHAEMKKWVYELKAGKQCVKCGESHRQCLDFHHRNPAEKSFGIKEGLKKGTEKEKILAEITKCDILCSNCHAKLHRNG